MKDTTTTTLTPCGDGFHLTFEDGFVLSIQYGRGSHCENQNADARDGPVPATHTCEVAVMDSGGNFVVLPYNVAGYVPVGNIAQLIESVQCHDWERVLLLCGEVDEPDYSKFPEKSVDYA